MQFAKKKSFTLHKKIQIYYTILKYLYILYYIYFISIVYLKGFILNVRKSCTKKSYKKQNLKSCAKTQSDWLHGSCQHLHLQNTFHGNKKGWEYKIKLQQ